MGTDATVLSVDRLPLPARRPLRGHLRALFRARLAYSDGQAVERDVLVEGVGLGYLGAHSLDYARLLGGFSPRIFGLEEGLLYREWIADERRVQLPAGEAEPFLAT